MKRTKEKNFIALPWTLERGHPPFEKHDIKYPESLVRHFLKLYAKPGDAVFDPFTGLGTTLFVAEEMNCIPYGVEHDGGRQEWVAGQMQHWTNLKRGDAADMLRMGFPKMDFAMTSPPYMPKHHKWNPLYGGDPKHAGYDVYLKRMGLIFKQMKHPDEAQCDIGCAGRQSAGQNLHAAGPRLKPRHRIQFPAGQ